MVDIEDEKSKVGVKNELKLEAKKMLKTVIKLVLIIVIVILILAGAILIIKIDDGSYKEGKKSNAPYVVREQLYLNEETKIDNVDIIETDDGYAFDIDLDARVDEIIKTLDENDSNVYNYISEKNVKEYLKDFIKAELITQYPDLRSAEKIGTPTKEGEFQGCIEIHRALPDGTEKKLTFVPYDTFNSGTIDSTNYFTLDEDGNLVFSGWTRTTTNVTSNVPDVENIVNKVEYKVTNKPINYKSTVEKYTMPFDFLWALTVMGDDEEFSHNVAKLALDSQIIFTVQDNLTTIIAEGEEEYDIEEEVKKSADIIVLER